MSEKSVSEIGRPLREQYEKGLEALKRSNLDYALALFAPILQQEPSFYACREALRAAQFRKASGNTSFFKKVLGTAGSSPLVAKGQLALRSNPVEALGIAEQILNGDPNHSMAHKMVAEAALQLGFPKTAVLSLEILFKNNPQDKDIAVKLVRALTDARQVERAEKFVTELEKVYPYDPEVMDAAKGVSVKKTMTVSGYEQLEGGKGSYRDILRDKKEAVVLEQENRSMKDSGASVELLNEYIARSEREPENWKLLKNIAEMYMQGKEYEKGLTYYQRIRDAGASDADLEQEILDSQLQALDDRIKALKPGESGYEEQRKSLEDEKIQVELDTYQRLVERYPNELGLRFELGKRFFKAGKITPAIQEFQKSQNNLNKRLSSMLFLGKCFATRKMYDLSARTLENAIKEKLVFDDEKKELLYELGDVLEKMGKPEEAVERYKLIFEVDIGFRDVAEKVDAFYSGEE